VPTCTLWSAIVATGAVLPIQIVWSLNWAYSDIGEVIGAIGAYNLTLPPPSLVMYKRTDCRKKIARIGAGAAVYGVVAEPAPDEVVGGIAVDNIVARSADSHFQSSRPARC